MEMMREAKRSREAAQYFTYQRRLLKTGVPPREEMYWRREEQLLFKAGARMEQGINFDQYEDIEVEKRGGLGKEEPCESFQQLCKDFEIPQILVENIERCGYSKPTPVQKHSMPTALEGTDVMVAAQTGSGKTAAFLVPLITRLLRDGLADLEEGPTKPRGIVLAPTRELCQQIALEARKLCFRSDVRISTIYGGADSMPQLKQLAEGCELAICTPGRLEDFLGRGVVSMEQVTHVVLDEADRMLDMGFEPQIRSIIEGHGMPVAGRGEGRRQTMMFSATFPKEIQDLAQDFLDPNYLWIGVGRVGSASVMVDQRFADVSTVEDDDKFSVLLESIQRVRTPEGNLGKTLIFANSKTIVDDLTWKLADCRIRASQIHGGLTQAARERALNDFRNGRVSTLVATDVAARGLDLPGIDHVVNYELPLNAEDYVHRIGRTGRIGNTGVSTSMVSGFEPALREIVKSIQAAAAVAAASENSESVENLTPLPRWVEQQALRGGAGSVNRYSSQDPRGGGRGAPPRRPGSVPPGGKGGGKGRNLGDRRYDDVDQRYGGGDSYRGGRESSGRAGRDRYSSQGRTGFRGARGQDETPPWARNLPPRERGRY